MNGLAAIGEAAMLRLFFRRRTPLFSPETGKIAESPKMTLPHPAALDTVDKVDGVLTCRDPEQNRGPVVFDSPHRGQSYPSDFRAALPMEMLRSTEDRFVDELFSAAPLYGATLLHAIFPRSYIDPNRHHLDLDASLLAEPWPEELQPGSKTANGKGLIRSRAMGKSIYDRKLSLAEVEGRVEAYWKPYQETLSALLTRRWAEFGAVWHINCHSWTPPDKGRDGNPVRHLDFCLGDRDGATCDPEFTAFVAETLEGMGYVVRINRPFKGMELIRRNGAPERGRHSLQCETGMHLYRGRGGCGKSGGVAQLKDNIERCISVRCDRVRPS